MRKVVAASVVVAALVLSAGVAAALVTVLSQKLPGTTVQPRPFTVEGALIYQPAGTNYTTAQPAGTGSILTDHGARYPVSIPTGFDTSLPIAMAGSFQLMNDSSLPGYYAVVSALASPPSKTATLNGEVNLSINSLGIAAANLTFGFSTSPSDPVAFLALGTYPTFFSNVTIQGVDLNLSNLGKVFNVNISWLDSAISAVDARLPASPNSVVLVNQTISLASLSVGVGQAQMIITPQNVSSFILSLSNASDNESAPNVSMVSTLIDKFDEELVVLASVSLHQIDYQFLLAPVELNRTVLAGLVSLQVETSYLTVLPASGVNVSLPSGLVHVELGVTWNRAPMTSSGYALASVPGLWAVAQDRAVTVQSVAVGISLADAANLLEGMGYSDGQYLMDIATLQNPAVFVLVNPEIVQNPGSASTFSSYAVAIVPEDELSLQTSVDLYLTVSGVVYNASYYVGCAAQINVTIPACPILVADTVTLGHPGSYTLDQLDALSQPTLVSTEGLLTGTTVKRVCSSLCSSAPIPVLSELVQNSPIDVGLYDTGYSNNEEGYNLPTLYLTWGEGPNLTVSPNASEGLYYPISNAASGEYLSNYSNTFLPKSGLLSSVYSILQSYVSSILSVIGGGPLNGSVPVPGLYLMMDLSPGANQAAMLTANGEVTQACPTALSPLVSTNCTSARLTFSANSNQYLDPAVSDLIIGLSGPTAVTTAGTPANYNCMIWFSSSPACALPNDLPHPGGVDCPALTCSLSPYHVSTADVYFCYAPEPFPLGSDTPCGVLWTPVSNTLSPGTYDVYYALYYDWTLGDTSWIQQTSSYQLTLT